MALVVLFVYHLRYIKERQRSLFVKNISLDKTLTLLDKEGIFTDCKSITDHRFSLQHRDEQLLRLFNCGDYVTFLAQAIGSKKISWSRVKGVAGKQRLPELY